MDYTNIINIVNKAKSGDEDSVKTLLKYYNPLIKSCINKIKKPDHMTQDDMESEAIVLFLNLLSKFDSKLSNFGYYIKINLFVNLLSKIKNISHPNECQLHDIYIDNHNDFDKIDFNQDLQQAMKILNTKQQLAINLYFFKEYSQEDCSKYMNISQAAFSKLLERSLKNLRFFL